jgi:hypothetical protein
VKGGERQRNGELKKWRNRGEGRWSCCKADVPRCVEEEDWGPKAAANDANGDEDRRLRRKRKKRWKMEDEDGDGEWKVEDGGWRMEVEEVDDEVTRLWDKKRRLKAEAKKAAAGWRRKGANLTLLTRWGVD